MTWGYVGYIIAGKQECNWILLKTQLLIMGLYCTTEIVKHTSFSQSLMNSEAEKERTGWMESCLSHYCVLKVRINMIIEILN